MRKQNLLCTAVGIAAILSLVGCVERELTINTRPQGAQVSLNDEQIGLSPATVSFNWYGDYNITISKAGYETLKTHRKLKAPWYDYFPFDFFASAFSGLNPTGITDSYEWTFELEPKKKITAEQLIEKAARLKARAQ